jgi:hypothetical protein
MQYRAIGVVHRTVNVYGVVSLPIWNELLELAVNDRNGLTRELCQALVQRYLKNKAGAEEMLYTLLEEAEKKQPRDVDKFLVSCALIAVQNNSREEAAEILASVISKDENPPDIRDAVFLQLRLTMGSGPELIGFWRDVRKNLVVREAKKEVSHLVNLRGMMEPQGKLKGKVMPRKPERAEVEIARKVARS